MLVEINPKRKLKDGDILIFEKGKFEPKNLVETLKETQEKINEYQNEVGIFKNEIASSERKIDCFEEKLNKFEKDLNDFKSFFVEILNALGGGKNV